MTRSPTVKGAIILFDMRGFRLLALLILTRGKGHVIYVWGKHGGDWRSSKFVL